MGVENNDCVIATTWDSEAMQKVKDWIGTLNGKEQSLFAFIPSLVNNKETLFMAPCGSNKGWATDAHFEDLRNQLIELLGTLDNEDRSNPFEWVEVSYGDFGQKVVRGNCLNKYGDEHTNADIADIWHEMMKLYT